MRERGLFIVVYYIYSIIVFSQSGLEYGRKLKENDKTVFTVQLTDGTFFDNSQYGYINKMGNHVFLYEKSSKSNIILHEQNIECLKIRNDDSRNPLIYQIIKGTKQNEKVQMQAMAPIIHRQVGLIEK